MSSSARPCFTLSFLNGGFRPVAQLCRGIGRAAIGPGWARSDLAADLVHIPSRRDSIETGKRADIVAISPPNQFPQAVWDELVKQKKLKYVGHGMYELIEE